jgi:riboflavin biosynthesis pyrimidine reductase
MLIGSFLDAGQVDEFVLHVIPVLIGKGIPLLARRHRDVPLALLSSRTYADGVVRLHYQVRRGAPKTKHKTRRSGISPKA